MKYINLNNAIAEEYEVPLDMILPENDIRITLDLDSMRAMNLIVIVKRCTGILITPRIFPRFTTFQSLYDYIDEQRAKSI